MMIRVFAMNVEGQNLAEESRNRYCSKARLQQAENMQGERQKRLFLGAEILLNRSLEAVGQAVLLPVAYRKNAHGKPYLLSPADLYVNWSHSGNWVVCALSDAEVGVDLQRMEKEPKDALIRRFLQPEEQKHYDRASSEQQKRLFYEYWAVKESYLKALGTGFCTPLDTFYVKMEGKHPKIIQRDAGKLYSSRLLEAPDKAYAAAVCIQDTQGEVQEEILVEILSGSLT